ncbi:MAG: hypothetical protein JXA52_07670, partial [Planctomycetes bacterium]|nr:hypothetical protein [Planctomycetota bacterium]
MKMNLSLQSKTGVILLLTLIITWPFPAVAAEPEEATLQTQLRSVMENPFILRGDNAGAIRYWLEHTREYPDSASTELALRMIRSLAPIDLPQVKPFEISLEQYLAGNPRNGCAADAARRLLADWRAKRGEFSQARELERQGAVLMEWLVAGPFGHYANANFDTVFPPEEGIDSLAKGFQGSREEVSWRPLQPDPFTHLLQPYESIHPSTGAALYLLMQIKITSKEAVYLHLDCPASWKLWINRRLLRTINRLEAYQPNDAFVAIPEPGVAGWKQVLLKVYSPLEDAELRVRLCDAEGKSLPGETFQIDNSVFHQPHQRSQPSEASQHGAQPDWFLPLLERAAAEVTEEPPVHRALAMAYRLQGIPDQARAEALLALEKDGGTVYSHLLLAEMESASYHLPQQNRANNSRQHYAAALALDPACIPAAIALAEAEDKDGSPQAALERLEKLLQDNPACETALRLRAQLALDLDWNEEAERWAGEYAKAAPGSLGVELLRARTALRFQRVCEVAQAYEAARLANQSQRLLWLAQLKALGRSGDYPAANKLAKILLAVAPQSVTVLERVTQHYLRFNDYSRALTIISQACNALPANESLWRLKGDILIQADLASARDYTDNQEAMQKDELRDSALQAYQKSLALSPSQPELRELILRLQAGSASSGMGGIGNTGIP